MIKFKVQIDPDALLDIQNATDWYNMQSTGFGFRFQKQVKQQINSLKTKAEFYGVRYTNVRCMIIKKFPFLVHYIIEDSIVKIFAVLHTSRNPLIWRQRRLK